MFKKKISWFGLIFSLFIFSIESFAQGITTGQLRATITDPTAPFGQYAA